MDRSKVEDYFIKICLNYKPLKDSWNYEDGCLLKGFLDLFLSSFVGKFRDSSGRNLFLTQVLKYLSENIDEKGQIRNYNSLDYNTNDVATGVILYNILWVGGRRKHRLAINQLRQQLCDSPILSDGLSLWHSRLYPNQLWLDSLYMAQPFWIRYLRLAYGDDASCVEIVERFQFVERRMKDKTTKLYYHGYDDKKTEQWANAETGCSATFYSGGMGYLAMALIDVLEWVFNPLEEIFLKAMLVELIETLLKYQDKESKMWYQVTNKPDSQGNYLETSASLMFSYTMIKGSRLGFLPPNYADKGIAIFDAIADRLLKDVHLGNMCQTAGLGLNPQNGQYRDGSEAYYYNEKVVEDDYKGVGVAMMVYAQILMTKHIF